MSAASLPSTRAVFELKNAALPLFTLSLTTTDLGLLAEALEQRVGGDASFFNDDPVLVDLADPAIAGTPLDAAGLVALLRRFRLLPVATRGGSPEQAAALRAAGLADAPELAPTPRGAKASKPVEVVREVEVVKEVVKEVVREVSVPTLVVDKPLRSGQQVYARGGDLVVLAAVNHGAELIADGHIHVYAPLRGKAIAGARGNTEARIFTTCLEAELLSIAGTYRTSEAALPPDVRGRAAQIRLLDDKLVMEPLVS